MVCGIIRLIVLLIAISTRRSLGAGETAPLPAPSIAPPQPPGPTQPGQPASQQLAYQAPPTQPTGQPNSLRPSQVQRPSNNVNNGLTVSNLQPLLQAALAAAPNIAAVSSPTPIKQPVKPGAAVPKATVSQTGGQVQRTAPPVNGHQSYANEDPIVQVDYATIGDEVLRKQTANFVYFNANFNHCRNCDKFFSVWKELALDLRWWQTVVRLFVINCSDEDNTEVCRRAGVTQFPQVRYYWIQSGALERDGQRLRILGKSIHAMRHIILDKVLESYAAHNKLLGGRKRLTQAQPGQRPSTNTAPLLTPLVPQGTPNQAPTNPLAPLLSPLIGQLLSGSPGKSSSPAPSAPLGGLSGIMGLLSAGQGGSSSSSGSGLSGQGIGQLIGALLSAGSARQGLSIQPLAGNWPELQPIEVGDTQQLLRTVALLDGGKALGTLLIMETQEFLYTGPEVMLDLSPYVNQTDIVRVRDERSQLSKALTKRDDIQAPALICLSASHEPRLILTAPKYTNDEDLRRAFVRAFERRQIKYPVKRVWSVPSGLQQQLTAQQQQQLLGLSQDDEETIGRADQLYMGDLTNAIRASLMEQVFRHPDLSDDQYNVLVKYVYALINYFPFNNDDSLKFCKRLHAWLQNQVSPMDVGEYKRQFHDIDEVLPRRDWLACRSLSSTQAIPNRGNKSQTLFENPSQLGKVVSNFTRLLRDQRQQANKLKSLFSVFASGASPVVPDQNSAGQVGGARPGESRSVMGLVGSNAGDANGTIGAKALAASPDAASGPASSCAGDSPIERIIKSLTSGSLGSDSSILKLISSALTGADGGDSASGAGSKSKFAREYPCGAWKLAHVMVVNEYIKDSPRKDVKHIVLHSLYQYMLQFYACPTCGNRVSDVSNEFRLHLDEHLVEQADSVILLWKVHNRISKRLESELRPGSPGKTQFPGESLCPKCRAPRAQNDPVSTPNWHDKQVLNFLVHHYRPQRIIASNSASSAAPASSSPAAIGHFALLLGCLLMSSRLASDASTQKGRQ